MSDQQSPAVKLHLDRGELGQCELCGVRLPNGSICYWETSIDNYQKSLRLSPDILSKCSDAPLPEDPRLPVALVHRCTQSTTDLSRGVSGTCDRAIHTDPDHQFQRPDGTTYCWQAWEHGRPDVPAHIAPPALTARIDRLERALYALIKGEVGEATRHMAADLDDHGDT